MTRGGATPWILGGAIALLAVARSSLLLITVEGISMEPSYADGDLLLMVRRPLARPRRGQEIILREPPGGDVAAPRAAGSQYAVKRLASTPGQPAPVGTAGVTHRMPVPAGHVAVLGDNAAHSTDSREWGVLRNDQVVGVILGRVRRSDGKRQRGRTW
ncbi:S26 family signal peptidase [Streptomyces sp. A1277]|uniref:S26 family signal peptidase n=1 Tax=Streptomyces sp. A1277 TaxID=2563103 RepID=UPI0010A29082|nr:S26 family signal peptidase [Streptomyces sp. A1277]THA33214.1 S26 family signal peptidase [Streptomyces sp. A1277]